MAPFFRWHRSAPFRTAAAGMESGGGGEGRLARWAAGGPRLRFREMPQNRVHHIVLGDERDHLHLRAAGRAQQPVGLADPLDQLRPAPPEGEGVASLDTSRTGGRAGVCPPASPTSASAFRRFPRDRRVPPRIPPGFLRPSFRHHAGGTAPELRWSRPGDLTERTGRFTPRAVASAACPRGPGRSRRRSGRTRRRPAAARRRSATSR